MNLVRILRNNVFWHIFMGRGAEKPVMRVLPTRIHGYLDYMAGLLLIIAPWLFDFAAGGPETWMPVMVGLAVITYSLATGYEPGLSPVISMKHHLLIDLFAGSALAISPWLFGFADYVYLPHLALGIFAVILSFITKQQPSVKQRLSHG